MRVQVPPRVGQQCWINNKTFILLIVRIQICNRIWIKIQNWLYWWSFLGRLVLRCGKKRISVLILRGWIVFDAWFLVRELARNGLHNRDSSDLRPTKIALFHLLFVMLHPPISILEQRTNHNWIVALSYNVFINDILERNKYSSLLKKKKLKIL